MSTSDPVTERASGRKSARLRGRIWFGAAAVFTIVAFAAGCRSLPKLDATGESLCSWPQSGAERLSTSRENELEKNVAGTSSCGDSPWVSANTVSAGPVGQESLQWSAQRPNGAVLFPKGLSTQGPLVVLEPRSLIAQVGSEVVMVASFVGPENDRLRVGEALEWNLDGAGRFLTTNPNNGCLYCDAMTTKKISDQSMTTTTSSRLWRIHRGTSTPTDDISILRGQSWATVQSFQEGTSTISVLASDIDNWSNRTAGGQIHWIDAAFYYPKSGISPIAEPQTLITSVFRKSTGQARPGWIVRYEIVSGPAAGFGPNFDQAVEIMTDDSGEAKTILTDRDGADGPSKIKVQIIRPAAGSLERVVVDEKTVTHNWSGNAPFNLRFSGASKVKSGERSSFQMDVKNLTDTALDAVVRVNIPPGTTFAASVPTATVVQNNVASWILEQVPAGATQVIRFDLDILTAGNFDFDARVERKTASTVLTAPPSMPTAPISATPPRDPFGLQSDTSAPVAKQPPAPQQQEGRAALTFVKPFPASAAVGEEFSAVFKATKTGTLPAAIISMSFPEDTYYIVKETGDRHAGSVLEPLEFTAIQFNMDYPVHFAAEKAGIKAIEIRLLEESTRKVLASEKKTINITPAAPGTPTSGTTSDTTSAPASDTELDSTPSQPPQGVKTSFTMDIQGENAPNFATGKDATFVFNVKNNENYQLSGLVIECTPELTRQTSAWTLVSSDPAGASPILDGAYRLTLPAIPAGSQQSASLTFTAKSAIDVGTFVATLQTDSGETIGEVKASYSIQTLHNAKRPESEASLAPESERLDHEISTEE